MTTYTNDKGEKFEQTDFGTPNGAIVIRPIKPSVEIEVLDLLNNYPREAIEKYLKDRPIKEEPKWTLEMTNYSATGPLYNLNFSTYITPDQSQLIKEALEALMEYITMPRPADFEHRYWPNIVHEARNAVQKGQDD